MAEIDSAATKIIGAYFGDGAAYLAGHPKDRDVFKNEFAIDVFDPEIEAIHRLALDRHSPHVDDRRITVELQTDETIDLRIKKPIAVVAPAPYLDDHTFRNQVVNIWNSKPISYPISSLNTSSYYNSIYERVKALYDELGLI